MVIQRGEPWMDIGQLGHFLKNRDGIAIAVLLLFFESQLGVSF
jgi:hypothetical protein